MQCFAFARSQQRVEFKNPCSVFLSLFYLCRTCLDNFSRPLKVISLNVQLIPQFQFSFVVCQKGMILEIVERNRDRIHCFARKFRVDSFYYRKKTMKINQGTKENRCTESKHSDARVSSRAWSNEFQKFASILQYLKRCPRYQILYYLVERKG